MAPGGPWLIVTRVSTHLCPVPADDCGARGGRRRGRRGRERPDSTRGMRGSFVLARWVGCSGGCCVGAHVVKRGERAAICTDCVGAMRELLNERHKSQSAFLVGRLALDVCRPRSRPRQSLPPPPPPTPVTRPTCQRSAHRDEGGCSSGCYGDGPLHTDAWRRAAAPAPPRYRLIRREMWRQRPGGSERAKIRDSGARGGPSPWKVKVRAAHTEGVRISQQRRCLRLLYQSLTARDPRRLAPSPGVTRPCTTYSTPLQVTQPSSDHRPH